MTRIASAPNRSWLCPSCGRRVPTQIRTCRCGTGKPENTDRARGRHSRVRPSAATSKRLPWEWIGWGLAAALAVLLGWQQVSGPSPLEEGPDETRTTPTPDDPAFEDVSTARAGEPDVDDSAVGPDASSFEDVIAKVLPAVVSVETSRGVGTGFFIERSLVVTNHHVLGSGLPTLRLSNGEKIQGEVWKEAESSDLAIIRLDRGSYDQPLLELATAEDLRVGQEVYAIGSAMGVLDNTVTRGIVSALRSIGDFTLIQTDAAINPGNSGGPLIDRKGRVVGITTLKMGEGESLGFAVAAKHATDLLEGRDPMAFLFAPSYGGRSGPSNRMQDYELTLNELVTRVALLSAQWKALWAECSDTGTNEITASWDDTHTWSPNADTAFITRFSTYTAVQVLFSEVRRWDRDCPHRYLGIVRDVYSIVTAYDRVYEEYDAFAAEHDMLEKVGRQLPKPSEIVHALRLR